MHVRLCWRQLTRCAASCVADGLHALLACAAAGAVQPAGGDEVKAGRPQPAARGAVPGGALACWGPPSSHLGMTNSQLMRWLRRCCCCCCCRQVERYNGLLVAVRRSCAELVRAIRGLVVMSRDLEQVRGAARCCFHLCGAHAAPACMSPFARSRLCVTVLPAPAPRSGV